MSNKDYYSILGVDKNATKDEIKKSYREKSKKWHPDLCRDESKKAEYTEKFQEINEAYQVLSDDNKRAEYDNGGKSAFSGRSPFGDDFDLSDIFNFGGFGGFSKGFNNKNAVKKGQGIRLTVKLTLKELFEGVSKTIRYKRMTVCDECHGSGAAKNAKVETCSHCGGTGIEFLSNGFSQTMRTCTHCHGSGEFISEPCHKCNGNGLMEETHETTIKIPKGLGSGMQLTMKGLGSSPFRNKGENGDLFIVIDEIQDDKFMRDGDDLYIKINVPILDAIMGTSIDISTIDDKKLTTKIPQGVVEGNHIRFNGYGMPIYNSSKRGNMYGIISIVMPKALNDEEKELINNLKEKEHFK